MVYVSSDNPYFICDLKTKKRKWRAQKHASALAGALSASQCPQSGFLACQPTPGEPEDQGDMSNVKPNMSHRPPAIHNISVIEDNNEQYFYYHHHYYYYYYYYYY